MKPAALIGCAVLVTGCMSGPRHFDGILGYRVEQQPLGQQVTYRDESRVSREATLSQIAQVCEDHLGQDVAITDLIILSETIYDQDVPITIQVPVGTTATGESNPALGGYATPPQPETQQQQVMQAMTIRKIVALCPTL